MQLYEHKISDKILGCTLLLAFYLPLFEFF